MIKSNRKRLRNERFWSKHRNINSPPDLSQGPFEDRLENLLVYQDNSRVIDNRILITCLCSIVLIFWGEIKY